jgi:hypothetical protein
MDPERRPVRVIVHAPMTDFMMSGYDENGAQYTTVILGHRTFAKTVDLPGDPRTPPVVLQINERDYVLTNGAAWTEADGQWQLETTLPAEDNQPLNDCLDDPSWTEIPSRI